MSSIDKYLCKVPNAYPYYLEAAIESLEYNMSVDNNNAATLCLYGRVYAEQLQDYATAKMYFQDALNFFTSLPPYVLRLTFFGYPPTYLLTYYEM